MSKDNRKPLSRAARTIAAALLTVAMVLTATSSIYTLHIYMRPRGKRAYRPDSVFYEDLMTRTEPIAVVLFAASCIAALFWPSLCRRWWFWLIPTTAIVAFMLPAVT